MTISMKVGTKCKMMTPPMIWSSGPGDVGFMNHDVTRDSSWFVGCEAGGGKVIEYNSIVPKVEMMLSVISNWDAHCFSAKH